MNIVNELRQNRVCVDPSFSDSTCTLSGRGIYKSAYYDFVLKIDGKIIEASNTFNTATTKLGQLEQARLCETRADQQCNLLARGVYRSAYYDYRVAIGSEVIDATNNRQTAFDRLNSLRDLGVCY